MLELARIGQELPRPRITDIPGAVRGALAPLAGQVRPGLRVAVTAGSRGIAGIPQILRAVVSALRDLGAEPFVFSGMGSHGGATPVGQRALLAHLGITEAAVGAPLRITSDALAAGTTESGHVLYCDAEAHAADAILVVNRVKAHTSFRGELESGLFKMVCVGMGKHPGATQVHKLGARQIYPAIREMGRLALQKLPILGGLAILENGYEETARLEFLAPADLEAGERRLLAESKAMLPGLPVQELDLLIVDEIGKTFSGTGVDTNVIGRWKVPDMPEPDFPQIGRIVTLRLAAASEGNANGLGLADFTTRKLAEAIDWNVTLTNISTTNFWGRAQCPPFLPSDQAAIDWALRSLQLPPEHRVRAARIRNTLHLDQLWVSPAVLDEVLAAGTCTLLEPARPLAFDAHGDLELL